MSNSSNEKYRNDLSGGIPVCKIVARLRWRWSPGRYCSTTPPPADQETKENLARFMPTGERRTSMIWVEHDMQMVADLADRIYVIDYGRYITEGPPQEVLSDPKVTKSTWGARPRRPRERLIDPS